MKIDRIISKSKYLAGLQCPKYLWYLINNPEEIPPFDEATQFRFQQGHEVGNLAKLLFPDGIDIEHGVDINAELAKARELAGLASSSQSYTSNISSSHLIKRHVLFEPSFTYKNAFARADILEPSGTNAWNIIEVKSASSIKDINKHDISFQKYCYEGAGLKIDKCYLMYLNKDFIKGGPIDPEKFFVMDDVTGEAKILKEGVEENINMMLDAINCKTYQDIKISKNCYNPYTCQMKKLCWECLPKNNVFELYRGKDLACSFYQNGISRISNIDNISILNPIQLIQYRTVKENSVFIDKKGIELFLNNLKYPLFFLDFETFATAIPLFDDLRPYQNIPFQFSCHISESTDSEPKNFYFLAEGNMDDPRIGFLESLKKALGYEGKYDSIKYSNPTGSSILVYYESFEKNILKELARAFPENAWWIEDAIYRIVDLYGPFGKFYYYNPEQRGSASLKNVLPALTGVSYDDVEIKNGEEASLRYLNMIFLKGEKEQDRHQVEKRRKDLLDYCSLDTEGMIFILRELYKIIKN